MYLRELLQFQRIIGRHRHRTVPSWTTTCMAPSHRSYIERPFTTWRHYGVEWYKVGMNFASTTAATLLIKRICTWRLLWMQTVITSTCACNQCWQLTVLNYWSVHLYIGFLIFASIYSPLHRISHMCFWKWNWLQFVAHVCLCSNCKIEVRFLW